MNVENTKALLTGASGGIGRAIANRLAQGGALLTLVGRNQETLQDLNRSLPGKHRVLVADITTQTGRAAVLEHARAQETAMLINAAGVMDFQFVEQQSSACIEQMITTNMLAPVLLCHSLIPVLRQHEQAAIVNIGSIYGSIGHPGFSAYCASKFGLRGFTEALQRELADSPIRVLYLAPRATLTDLNTRAVDDLNKALGNSVDRPEQVAEELMNVLARSRRQRFMGWPENLFVRLNGLFPGLVHNALVRKLAIIRHHAQT
ncbi:SDR family oxidoreductase [Elongatibacter sediminis]|uniref:SDR family oxidoreductase n=1 Tax=Elongatibacter sediminis TaxID=3119006 RepID=A0AAW9RJT3_9GAMM